MIWLFVSFVKLLSFQLLNWLFNPSPAETGYTLPANNVDPDQLASSEANWSGSALFVIKYICELYQQSGSSNLIGWKLEVGVAS